MTQHLLPTYMCSTSLHNAVNIDPNDSSPSFATFYQEKRGVGMSSFAFPEIGLLIQLNSFLGKSVIFLYTRNPRVIFIVRRRVIKSTQSIVYNQFVPTTICWKRSNSMYEHRYIRSAIRMNDTSIFSTRLARAQHLQCTDVQDSSYRLIRTHASHLSFPLS